jgi:hypothetical protein
MQRWTASPTFDLSSSPIMALGMTQSLRELCTRNLPEGKGRPPRKADNLTTICESNVWKMWEPQHPTNLRAFTACYRDSFTLTFYLFLSVRQTIPTALSLFCRTITAGLCFLRLCSSKGRPPLWSSGQSSWQKIQRSRVWLPALPDFLRSGGSGTGCTQPREYKCGDTLM